MMRRDTLPLRMWSLVAVALGAVQAGEPVTSAATRGSMNLAAIGSIPPAASAVEPPPGAFGPASSRATSPPPPDAGPAAAKAEAAFSRDTGPATGPIREAGLERLGQPHVRVWEIWNEPESPWFWQTPTSVGRRVVELAARRDKPAKRAVVID